jgi:hypothetical protein
MLGSVADELILFFEPVKRGLIGLRLEPRAGPHLITLLGSSSSFEGEDTKQPKPAINHEAEGGGASARLPPLCSCAPHTFFGRKASRTF